MAQISKIAVPNGDVTFYNGTGADIPAETGVILDATVTASQGEPACKIPAAAGGVVGTLGLTLSTIKNGSRGPVRMLGSGLATADGAITAGTTVQISDVATKMGRVKTAAAATAQLGMALNTAADGGPVQVWIDRAKNA